MTVIQRLQLDEKDPVKINSAINQLAEFIDRFAPALGQIAFPAIQNPSTDPNTLDDYEEGTWTPVLTFATPGDLAVSYTLQKGFYTKIGRLVMINLVIQTSAFSFTTASGACIITGLPFASNSNASFRAHAPLVFQGVNKAGYTVVFGVLINSSSQLLVVASEMGANAISVTAADMPTGGTVIFGGMTSYVV